MKEMTLSEFQKYVNTNCANRIEGSGIADIFLDGKQSFAIVCLKCGSMEVDIIGEDGIDYGGETGYSPGENVLKCRGCANAVSVYK